MNTMDRETAQAKIRALVESRDAAEAKARAMAAGYKNVKSCVAEYEALAFVLAELDRFRTAHAELNSLAPGDDCPVCGNVV